MITYDFRTKEVANIFDSITHFVLAAGFKGRGVAGAKKEDCSVVGENGALHVGYPIALLGKVMPFDFQSINRGRILINDCCIKHCTRCFYEIRGNVMYLTEEW